MGQGKRHRPGIRQPTSTSSTCSRSARKRQGRECPGSTSGTLGTVRQGAFVHRVVVNNISQGGLGAQCRAELEVGGEVIVALTGLAPQKGVVRWGRSGAYGITFNTVLGLPALVEWLKTQAGAGRS